MRAALRHGIGGLALALGLAGGLAAAPAQAADGSPPVPADDRVRVFAGQPAAFNLLANDTDPDGDELQVCRIGTTPRKLAVEAFPGNEVLVIAKPRASGTYTFTYYACDFETLVPATVTVKVLPTPNITVKKLSGRPGRLKVKNPADYAIRFLWGSERARRPDGKIRIGKHSSALVRVRRTNIIWAAIGKRGAFIDMGEVRRIKLPPNTQPPAPSELLDLKPAERRAWRR